MRVSHNVSAVFDDPNLVGVPGWYWHRPKVRIAPAVADTVTVPESAAANAAVKVSAVVAGMVAGAGSIDDLDLLRHGGMGRLFAGVRAPPTLAPCLRTFRFEMSASSTRSATPSPSRNVRRDRSGRGPSRFSVLQRRCGRRDPPACAGRRSGIRMRFGTRPKADGSPTPRLPKPATPRSPPAPRAATSPPGLSCAGPTAQHHTRPGRADAGLPLPRRVHEHTAAEGPGRILRPWSCHRRARHRPPETRPDRPFAVRIVRVNNAWLVCAAVPFNLTRAASWPRVRLAREGDHRHHPLPADNHARTDR